jgi:hypothetical protein
VLAIATADADVEPLAILDTHRYTCILPAFCFRIHRCSRKFIVRHQQGLCDNPKLLSAVSLQHFARPSSHPYGPTFFTRSPLSPRFEWRHTERPWQWPCVLPSLLQSMHRLVIRPLIERLFPPKPHCMGLYLSSRSNAAQRIVIIDMMELQRVLTH